MRAFTPVIGAFFPSVLEHITSYWEMYSCGLDYLLQRLEYLLQRLEFLLQKPEQLLQRMEHLLQRLEYLLQKPEHLLQRMEQLLRLGGVSRLKWEESKLKCSMFCSIRH